jgi:hypothetical protein
MKTNNDYKQSLHKITVKSSNLINHKKMKFTTQRTLINKSLTTLISDLKFLIFFPPKDISHLFNIFMVQFRTKFSQKHPEISFQYY